MVHSKNSYHILINEYSGGVSRLGLKTLEDLLTKTTLNVEMIEILPPDQFFDKVSTLRDSDHSLLIGGGDGTIKSCAEILMDSGKDFGILPLGTMNLMARDLEIPLEIDQALNAYEQGHTRILIDVGTVNDHPFLCCVGIGTMPETSEFREKNRAQKDPILIPRLTVFVLNQMDRIKQRRIRLSIDGQSKKLRTAALVISNNQYGPQGQWDQNNFKRQSLQDGILGIYSAAPLSLWDRIRFMLRLRFGDWRKDQVIDEWEGKSVTLNTKRREELISLDGETKTINTPLNFSIKQKALPLLVPKTIKDEPI